LFFHQKARKLFIKIEQKKHKAKQVPDGTSPTKKVKVEQTSGTVTSPPKKRLC